MTNIDRAARWAVRQTALPTVVKPCLNCSGTRHHPSGKFRVNANGKLLDVWLLMSCATCDRTWKTPVHERVHVQSLEPALLVAYEANDPAAVRALTMSPSLAAKNGYRLDWTGTWDLVVSTARPSRTVLITFELPAPIRVERLLTLGLGISRGEVRRMVADGRLHLPMAPDAKAHRDFEFTIDQPATSRDEVRQPAPPPTPRLRASG
ncbi:DUF1062 domain-containing protein [Saccharothrix obliqua]|uniref:DUF1062 domain-containing protein n=1 Tax=Saccharothrix obliqua TaxID=2861747 RepID=UPI001C5E6D0B|nr:DUF1062 domain-containing protein [Saccharothrix obliqua]MBW4722372.1 DUF1062 domain-containing protein [Saccharothrix obliqua]